jgi:hypothetical protein
VRKMVVTTRGGDEPGKPALWNLGVIHRKTFEKCDSQEYLVGGHKFRRQTLSSKLQGDRKLKSIQRVETMNKAVLQKQAVGVLVVSDKKPHDGRPATSEIGEKSAAQQVKIGGRYGSATHLFRKRGYGFHDSQAGNEEPCAGIIPELVYFRRANLGVVMLDKGTGIEEMVGH